MIMTHMFQVSEPALSASQRRYGDREQVSLGNLVRRPDGTLFIQGVRSTYTHTYLDPAVGSPVEQGPEEQVVQASLRMSALAPGSTYGLRRRQGTVNPNGGMINDGRHRGPILASRHGQPGTPDASVPHTLIPSRTVYRSQWVERTFEVPGGEVTLRRLRSSREGRGM